MNEMVERVSKAMMARVKELAEMECKPRTSYWPEYARAAIAAMREPTARMVDAADNMMDARDIWYAMIDELLDQLLKDDITSQ